MTETIFLTDCYLKELDANVVFADGNKIELDKSIFCYHGGGQLADNGEITANGETYKVSDVRKEDGRIINYVDREGLKQGDSVHLSLDWDRRYILMKYHTAFHVLTAVIHGQTGALITGGSIFLDKARADFSLEQFNKEQMEQFVRQANDAIATNQPVKMYFMNRGEALKIPGMVKLATAAPPNVENLRIVEIGNIDTQADGGTHVANTSEIGKIELIKTENKGKERK